MQNGTPAWALAALEAPVDATRLDRSGLRALSEAQAHGTAALGGLAVQGETLEHAESVLDSNQHLADQSARVLDGMTWGGWISSISS